MSRYFLIKFDKNGMPKSYRNRALCIVPETELEKVSVLISGIAYAVMQLASRFDADVVHVIRYVATQKGLLEQDLKLFVSREKQSIVFYESRGNLINERLFNDKHPLRYMTSFASPSKISFLKIPDSLKKEYIYLENLGNAFLDILPRFSYSYMGQISIFPSRVADILYIITNGTVNGLIVKMPDGQENLFVHFKERPPTYGEIKESSQLWEWLRDYSISGKI